ncbi:hypothetical protein Tco_0066912 [Tanacetum coccineum]
MSLLGVTLGYKLLRDTILLGYISLNATNQLDQQSRLHQLAFHQSRQPSLTYGKKGEPLTTGLHSTLENEAHSFSSRIKTWESICMFDFESQQSTSNTINNGMFKTRAAHIPLVKYSGVSFQPQMIDNINNA